MSSISKYRNSVTEISMENAIRRAVELRGGRCWAVRDSRKFAIDDMPDLIIVLPPHVALIELKSIERDLTPGQQLTMEMLAECTRLLSAVVRPEPRAGEIGYDQLLKWIEGVAA